MARYKAKFDYRKMPRCEDCGVEFGRACRTMDDDLADEPCPPRRKKLRICVDATASSSEDEPEAITPDEENTP